MLVRRKALLFTAASILVIGVLAVSVIGSAFAQQPAPPGVYVIFTRLSAAGETCPAIYKVTFHSQAGFEGKVNLTIVNLPNTVSVAFNPNPVFVPAGGSGNTSMVVMGSWGTPVGNLTLPLKISPPWVSVGGNGLDANGNPYLTLPISPCIGSPSVTNNISNTITTTTTTIVSISTVTWITSTVTDTIVLPGLPRTGEQERNAATSAWALSATISTMVLAAVVVLLLRRTRQ